ncbi:hypothetical protein CJ030_MR3G011997 [Morella rubra]|uniref:Uncharacterized protein n=1 Tax=Morella rubra TaxID=262757 RepID=A0A6A1W754_9ROSI|nr:hypothetical protein CJ030_MR3G011997 [Morella rubra]
MFQHYSVFNSKEEALEHPYPEMNKEEWTRVCDLFASEEFQRRSAINKENRAKLKIVHTWERGKNGSVTVAVRVRGKVIHEVEISLRCWGRKRVTCEV